MISMEYVDLSLFGTVAGELKTISRHSFLINLILIFFSDNKKVPFMFSCYKRTPGCKASRPNKKKKRKETQKRAMLTIEERKV